MVDDEVALTVRMRPEDAARLRALAERERRPTSRQAEVLILRALDAADGPDPDGGVKRT